MGKKEYFKYEKLSKIKNIIAISSGKGGVGKSTISANLAVGLALQGMKVGILDADIYGPSQTIMFGVEDDFMEAETDQHGKTTVYPVEKYGVKVASIGFVLNKNEALALRGPMLDKVLNLFFEQIEWGELDFLILDLPPGTGDIHLTLSQKIKPDGVILVTTPQNISVADVRKSVDLYRKMNVNILGIIENMSFFVPPDLPEKKYYIFGKDGAKKLSLELNIPLLGEIPFNITMQENSDKGNPIILDENANYQKEILNGIIQNIINELGKNTLNNEM
jgi:ATP-binding protein involved in chromosome partitioning